MNPYTQNWKTILKANPTDWLLQTDKPIVRWWTFIDILKKTYDDPDVRAAKKASLQYPPLVDLLRTQNKEGYWIKRDYYLPKSYGAFCRRRRIQNIALVWKTKSDTCTHDSIIRLLIQFSYKDDSRVHKAMGWLLSTQREDNMWLCGFKNSRYGLYLKQTTARWQLAFGSSCSTTILGFWPCGPIQ